MSSTTSQSTEENTFQGNAIPWKDWEKAAELAGLNPYHAHIGGEDYSRRLASQLEAPVLDVGCGWGGLLTHIDGKAVGIDISEYCIQKAREKTKDKENITVSQGSVFDINPDDFNTFQTVVSLDVFPLIEEKERALEKCSSALDEGGAIFITDYFAPSRFERVFTPYGGASPYSRKDYEQAIEQAGLSLASLTDRTEKCLTETKRITKKMNEDPLKEWMIENWSQKYYDYAVELAEEWTTALEDEEITYHLLEIEPQ